MNTTPPDEPEGDATEAAPNEPTANVTDAAAGAGAGASAGASAGAGAGAGAGAQSYAGSTATDPAPPRTEPVRPGDLGRVRRSRSDRYIGGVAGGLARHLDIDPLLVRVLFVVLTFFGGAGLFVYLACWLLIPDEGSDRAALPADEGGRRLLLIGVLAIGGLAIIGDAWGGGPGIAWPLLLIGGAVAAFVISRRSTQDRPPGTGSGYGAPGDVPPGYVPPGRPAPAAGAPGYTPADRVAMASPASATDLRREPSLTPSSGYGAPGWDVPPPIAPDPRKRGPLLFLPTLALIALTVGILAAVDVGGSDVPWSAYPAAATAIVGVMLLVGSVWGRGGGLILLGLLTLSTLGPATAADYFNDNPGSYTPTSVSELSDAYFRPVGDLTVDLTQIADADELDARKLDLVNGAGDITLIVPTDVVVDVTASVGTGSITLFDEVSEPVRGTTAYARPDPADGPTDLTVEINLGAGDVVVRHP